MFYIKLFIEKTLNKYKIPDMEWRMKIIDNTLFLKFSLCNNIFLIKKMLDERNNK